MLSAAQVVQFGLGIYVASLVVIAFARKLGAIMTATVVSARTGAAITAELATMKVQEEIDALRGMGLNVVQFLVVPKIIALTLMVPLLHLGFILVGVPYSVQELFTTTGGGSPYGPGHIAGGDGQRDIDAQEKAICRALGKRVAEVAKKLRG